MKKIVFDHLVNEKHCLKHRSITGISVMMMGVGIVQIMNLIDIAIVHYFAEVVGYFIHALGGYPILEGIAKAYTKID